MHPVSFIVVVIGGAVIGWFLRSFLSEWSRPPTPPPKEPKPAKPVKTPSKDHVCSDHSCFSGRDPRCAAGQCARHCGVYCPRTCRDGAEAEARAIALLSRYGPLEKEKT
jgi:hypothetical protein